jgi:hypothetical protein
LLGTGTSSLYQKIFCVTASTKEHKKQNRLHKGTKVIGIDTLSTYCLTNDMRDFDGGTTTLVAHSITGIGGNNNAWEVQTGQ